MSTIQTMPKPLSNARLTAMAVALVCAFSSSSVQALSLGRLNVLSTLGEPLVAEIDVPQITEAEAASLRLSTASDRCRHPFAEAE
jgi:pilus assembly protein FimV